MIDWAIVALIVIPLLAGIASVLVRHYASAICVAAGFALAATLWLVRDSLGDRESHVLSLAGWGAPLGIDLYVDSLSIAMLFLTVAVGLAISLYAGPYFAILSGTGSQRAGDAFWPVFMLLWTALNAVFLSSDIFNFYVTLELLTLAAVGLVGVSGKEAAVIAALRYLFSAIVASMFFLLGVATLYGQYGALDWHLLGGELTSDFPTIMGIVMVTVALLVKTALFPFHIWLPSAHSIAPAPVSALLSGVVLKASFYIVYRLWSTPFAAFDGIASGYMALAVLGCAAVVWGSVQAIRQSRAKQMLAFSSVAQVGYLFIFFGVAFEGQALYGLPYFVLSHGFAKSAAFLAVGALMLSCGSDELNKWKGMAQREPVLVLALGLASVSLIGLPPSGGFISKYILLSAAFNEGRFGFVIVILLGGLMAAAYAFKMIAATVRTSNALDGEPSTALPTRLRWIPLGLASIAILLGFVPALLLRYFHFTVS